MEVPDHCYDETDSNNAPTSFISADCAKHCFAALGTSLRLADGLGSTMLSPMDASFLPARVANGGRSQPYSPHRIPHEYLLQKTAHRYRLISFSPRLMRNGGLAGKWPRTNPVCEVNTGLEKRPDSEFSADPGKLDLSNVPMLEQSDA